MLKIWLVLLICVLYTLKIYAQITSCTCMPVSKCYQNISSTDGSGSIDIRVANPESGVTQGATTPRATVPTITPSTTPCKDGLENCCMTVSGCGTRFNIPTTPSTTPAAGQAQYGSQPWAALILGSDNSYIGGGVLMDTSNVLTVAHKVANRTAASLKVRLGDWDSSKANESYATQESLVTQIKIHQDYSASNLQNDIAILRLTTPVKISSFSNPSINAICIPGTTSFENRRCLVYGWGKDVFTGSYQSIMKETEIPVLTNADCQDRLRKARLGPAFVLNTVSFICAGGEAGRDACVGDGGSGLVCNYNGKFQVIGLVAWGLGCADVNVPGVYVRVQSYISWIQQNLA